MFKEGFKKFYDLFSIVRFKDFVFETVKFVSQPFGPPIIWFLNWRLRRERSYNPEIRNSQLKLVVQPFDKASVGLPVLKYIFGARFTEKDKRELMKRGQEVEKSRGLFTKAVIFFPILIIFSCVWIAFLVVVDLYIGSGESLITDLIPLARFGDINFGVYFFLFCFGSLFIFFLAFLYWFAGLIWVYWTNEWKRKSRRLFVVSENLINAETAFIKKAIWPTYTGERLLVKTTSIDLINREFESATDVQDLSDYLGEYTTEQDDLWLQYLSKTYGAEYIKVPSVFDSIDLFGPCEHCEALIACLNMAVEEGRNQIAYYKKYKDREMQLRIGEGGSRDDAKIETQVFTLWRDGYDRLFPPSESYSTINVWEEEDPGIFDTERGIKVKSVKGVSGALRGRKSENSPSQQGIRTFPEQIPSSSGDEPPNSFQRQQSREDEQKRGGENSGDQDEVDFWSSV